MSNSYIPGNLSRLTTKTLGQLQQEFYLELTRFWDTLDTTPSKPKRIKPHFKCVLCRKKFQTSSGIKSHYTNKFVSKTDQLLYLSMSKVGHTPKEWRTRTLTVTVHSISDGFSETYFNPYWCGGISPVRVSSTFGTVKDLSGSIRNKENDDLFYVWNSKAKAYTDEQKAALQAEYKKWQENFPPPVRPTPIEYTAVLVVRKYDVNGRRYKHGEQDMHGQLVSWLPMEVKVIETTRLLEEYEAERSRRKRFKK